MLEFFITIWNILWPFGIIYGPLVLLVVICNSFPNLECFDQEKSGNPGVQPTSLPSAKMVDFKASQTNNNLGRPYFFKSIDIDSLFMYSQNYYMIFL
jgi:hypothetical protein